MNSIGGHHGTVQKVNMSPPSLRERVIVQVERRSISGNVHPSLRMLYCRTLKWRGASGGDVGKLGRGVTSVGPSLRMVAGVRYKIQMERYATDLMGQLRAGADT